MFASMTTSLVLFTCMNSYVCLKKRIAMMAIATIDTINETAGVTCSSANRGFLELIREVFVEVEVAQMVSDCHIFVLFLHLQKILILIGFP